MKIKVNKHKLNIHYRGSPAPWGSWTQQHAYCLRYAHSHHIESHLGKKQPQAKIAIAFLFGQLHFNNVTSHALFYGGHLIMRSKKCAMQNQGITLIRECMGSSFHPPRLGWTNSCWKRQVLMFYPLGKNTEKPWGRGIHCKFVSVLSLNPNLFAYLQVN